MSQGNKRVSLLKEARELRNKCNSQVATFPKVSKVTVTIWGGQDTSEAIFPILSYCCERVKETPDQ